MKTRYGLLTYHTENVGDEIQSLAANRFLPQVDYYFDRDNIDATKIKDGEKVKLIMNGWHTHHPENWPPKNSAIEPLLIALHVEQDALEGRAKDAFLSEDSRHFLKKYGPVGARNLPTKELFDKANIESYFSGCLTLTLLPEKTVKKQDFVLAVDVSDKIFAEAKKRTDRKIIRLDAYRTRNLTTEQKMTLAKYWLSIYQSAHAVITTRLHCMLPCLALGTPVLAISGNDPKRYAGLIELTNNVSEKEFLENCDVYNFDDPRANPNDFKKLAKSLVEKCQEFTGYDSKNSYLGGRSLSDFYTSPEFIDLSGALSREACRGETAMIQLQALKNETYANRGVRATSKALAKALKRKLFNGN